MNPAADTSQQFADRGWALVPDFLSPEVAETAYRYALLQIKLGHGKNSETAQFQGSRQEYADPLMETLLDSATPRMERLVGKRLWPSYSIYRLYEEGAELPRHRDRPSCEFSVSVCLGSDFSNLDDPESADWPLFADGVAVPCPPGGGLVYRGCDVEHWREPLRGNHQVQLFLHYVDQDGPFAEVCRYDCRPMLGVPSRFRHPEKLKQLEELKREWQSS